MLVGVQYIHSDVGISNLNQGWYDYLHRKMGWGKEGTGTVPRSHHLTCAEGDYGGHYHGDGQTKDANVAIRQVVETR